MQSKDACVEIAIPTDDHTVQVVEAQLHPSRPWVLIALSSGEVLINWTQSGEVLHRFQVDLAKYGPIKKAQFFDASCLLYNSLLPSSLVAEARANLVVVLCTKAIIVFDCVTKVSTCYAPAALATGLGGGKNNGALTGAFVGVSCEHIVVGTVQGSMLTLSLQNGNVSAFSGTSKIHVKPIECLVAVTGRPSPQLHRARIVSGCQNGVVAVWEVMCESPIYKTGPRVLSESAGSPVIDMRFDAARNRLACCFGNGSIIVWGFEEHSQEETVLATISKGSGISQVAIPRGSWNVPEDAFLSVTPQGRVALVLPTASAVKIAKQAQKGFTGSNFIESRPPSSVSEGLVAVRHVVDLLVDQKQHADSTQTKVVRFWQHPLSPRRILVLCCDGSPNKFNVFLCEVDAERQSIPQSIFTSQTRAIVPLDGRLVAKTGSRLQNEKTIALLSPFTAGDAIPQIIQDFSAEPIAPNLLNGIDLDKLQFDLWPGPMSTIAARIGSNDDGDDEDTFLLGFCWRDAKRFVVARCKLFQSDLSPHQPNVEVVHTGEGDAIAFAKPSRDIQQQSGGEILLLVAREANISTTGATAVTLQQQKSFRQARPSLTSLGFRSSRSFKSSAASKTNLRGSSSLNLNSNDQKNSSQATAASKQVAHYYLSVFKLGDTTAIAEVQHNQPVREIVADAQGEVFLVRSDPPSHLQRSLKPWSRFFSLPVLVKEKRLMPASPILPSHRLVAKSEFVKNNKPHSIFALSLDIASDRVAILDCVDGKVTYRLSVFTGSKLPLVSMKWQAGSLVLVTEEEISLAFVGLKSPKYGSIVSQMVIAARGRHAHPMASSTSPRGGGGNGELSQQQQQQQQMRRDSLHVHDDRTRPEDAAFSPVPSFVRPWEYAEGDEKSPFPVPCTRPLFVTIGVLDIEKLSGDLVMISPNGKVGFIPLRHPLIRLGMLASAGLSKSALEWTHSLSPNVESRNEALLMLNRLGFPKEASMIQGASPLLLLDLCIQNQLVDRAADLFHSKSKSLAALIRLDHESDSEQGLSHVERLVLLLASGGKAMEISAITSRKDLSSVRMDFLSSLIGVAQTREHQQQQQQRS